MNPFDSYMLNKVRRLKDLRTRYAAMGEKALLAGVPEEDLEFATGIWSRSSSASSTAKAHSAMQVNGIIMDYETHCQFSS